MTAHEFTEICDSVWSDRASIVADCGTLSESALMLAVYWRIYKVGGEPAPTLHTHADLLDKLMQQYRAESA